MEIGNSLFKSGAIAIERVTSRTLQRLVVLALLAGPAQAELKAWSLADAEHLLECAVVFDRFEAEDGKQLPFDFATAAKMFRAQVAAFHGEAFVETVTRKHEARWQTIALDQTAANRLRARLPACQAFGVSLGLVL